MRKLGVLLSNDVRSLVLSSARYVASILFLMLQSFIFYFLLEEYIRIPQEYSLLEVFYESFWIATFFIVPLLTMRSFAEERRLGTLEALLATPIHGWQVVVSKFLAAYFLYMLLWGLTVSLPFWVIVVNDTFNTQMILLRTTPIVGGMSFIAMSGLLYIAIGIFCSSLTRSQLVAGMLSFSFLFILIVGGKWISDLPAYTTSEISWLQQPLAYLRTFEHLTDFTRGVIDSRPIFFYGSGTLLLLGLTTIMLGRKG